MNLSKKYHNDFERIYYEWDSALSTNDIERLLSLYASDATIESPLIPHILGSESGVIKGTTELRRFLESIVQRKPTIRKYYRTGYLTDRNRLMWEYPRLTPDKEQMDFVEVMELKNGFIQHHRVYWGWRGFKIIQEDMYHR